MSDDFHDVVFPLALAAGARGGPERRTEVLTLASGQEVRNAVWSGSRRRWDIGGAVDTLTKLHDVIAFFEARQGRLHAFRFRDPMDWSSAPPNSPVSALDQTLGVGDGSQVQFNLRKAYGDSWRDIRWPIVNTLRVAVNGVEVTDWTLNSGTLIFAAPPQLGSIVTAGFEFDCAVRFESDRLEGVVDAFDVGRALKIGLVEVV
ncbi:MAG: DUF2460 domain-containing protein [Pseudomonadota bacterium]